MADLTQMIVAKSDQLNADDLIGGPITVRVSKVDVVGGEQPVVVHYDGENGRPWKPCKGMTRVLVAIWGKESDNYAGKHITLFREPTVKWAGKEVGGIHISRMEGLTAPKTIPVTVSRGKKIPLTIYPLQIQQEAPQPPEDEIAGWLLEIDSAEMLADLDHVASEIKAKGYVGNARQVLGAAYNEAKAKLQQEKNEGTDSE